MSGETSLELLARARAGDNEALDDLVARYLPRLRRWASGRLPAFAREHDDTDDLVQETVIQTLRKLKDFEPQHAGALQGYLRQAVLNRIRDAIRRKKRRPAAEPLADDMVGDQLSPLEQVIGSEAVARYDAALATLSARDREAIIGRFELGYDYDELARELGTPTSDAARAAVRRAVVKLAERMRDVRD